MTPSATGAVTDFGTKLLAAFQPQNGASTSILIAEKAIPKPITNSRARQFARINSLRCQIGTAIATTVGPNSQRSGEDS
jgi:hypothetical protein